MPKRQSPLLPRSLGDARELALARHLAEADTAETELAIDGVGSATALATVLLARRKLRLAVRLDDHRCLSHKSSFRKRPRHPAGVFDKLY